MGSMLFRAWYHWGVIRFLNALINLHRSYASINFDRSLTDPRYKEIVRFAPSFRLRFWGLHDQFGSIGVMKEENGFHKKYPYVAHFWSWLNSLEYFLDEKLGIAKLKIIFFKFPNHTFFVCLFGSFDYSGTYLGTGYLTLWFFWRKKSCQQIWWRQNLCLWHGQKNIFWKHCIYMPEKIVLVENSFFRETENFFHQICGQNFFFQNKKPIPPLQVKWTIP